MNPFPSKEQRCWLIDQGVQKQTCDKVKTTGNSTSLTWSICWILGVAGEINKIHFKTGENL